MTEEMTEEMAEEMGMEILRDQRREYFEDWLSNFTAAANLDDVQYVVKNRHRSDDFILHHPKIEGAILCVGVDTETWEGCAPSTRLCRVKIYTSSGRRIVNVRDLLDLTTVAADFFCRTQHWPKEVVTQV